MARRGLIQEKATLDGKHRNTLCETTKFKCSTHIVRSFMCRLRVKVHIVICTHVERARFSRLDVSLQCDKHRLIV